MGLIELDKHHIPLKRGGIWAPRTPHFEGIFIENIQVNGLYQNKQKSNENKEKSVIPLYTRETRHVLDFSTKKNIQLTEKPVVKNGLISPFGGLKSTYSPLTRTFKEHPQNDQKRSFFCKFGHFWPKISKSRGNRNENGVKKRVFWRFFRQTRGVPRETRKRVPAR